MIKHFEGLEGSSSSHGQALSDLKKLEASLKGEGGLPKTEALYRRPEHVATASEPVGTGSLGQHYDLTPSGPEPWELLNKQSNRLNQHEKIMGAQNDAIRNGHERIEEQDHTLLKLEKGQTELHEQVDALARSGKWRDRATAAGIAVGSAGAITSAVYSTTSAERFKKNQAQTDELREEVARLRAAQQIPTSVNGPGVASQGIPATNGRYYPVQGNGASSGGLV